jgi:hypothetical protein
MVAYSKSYIQSQFARSDRETDSDTKGDILEKLLIYIFCKVRGVSLLNKDFTNCNRTEEIDLAFWTNRPISDLHFLETIIYVECKNTTNSVSSAEVNWFLSKVRSRQSKYGILIALNGITGSPITCDYAYSEVKNAFIREGITIFIIDRKEIEALKTTNDLVNLIKCKYTQIRLYGTIT